MTDSEYIKKVFESDSKQKKILARGEQHRKKTVRGCKLPSDYMTKREKERLNGEVMSYDMGKPMLWKQFRAMPLDLQREYISGLKRKFDGISSAEIADMLEVSYAYMCKYFQKIGVKSEGLGGHKSFDKSDVYDKWIAWRLGEEGFENLQDVMEEEKAEVPKEELNLMPKVFQTEVVDTVKEQGGISLDAISVLVQSLKAQGIHTSINISINI